MMQRAPSNLAQRWASLNPQQRQALVKLGGALVIAAAAGVYFYGRHGKKGAKGQQTGSPAPVVDINAGKPAKEPKEAAS